MTLPEKQQHNNNTTHMTNKNSKKSATSTHLSKKQQRQLTLRLEQEFEISGLYITREQLEAIGFDTSNVDDATMEEIAISLGDRVDWQGEDAIDVAEGFDIPKHQNKPTA
jgi:hypothetical protein